MSKKFIFNALRLVIAAALICWLMSRVNWVKLRQLDTASILTALGIAALLMCMQVSSGAWRWKLLLEAQGVIMPLHRAVLLSFQGMAFSLFMPGGALGGDVIKAALVAAETRSGKRVEGVTTVALDRLIGMSALFIIVLVIALYGMGRILLLPLSIRAAIFALLGFCAVGILFVGALFFQDLLFRFGWFKAMTDKLDRLCHGKLLRVMEAVALYRSRKGILLKAFLISLFMVHPFLLSAMFVLLWGIEGAMPDFLGSYLAISLGNSAAVIPITPGGLGARDKIAQMVLLSFGFSDQSAALAPLGFSAVIIFVSFLGLISFAVDTFLTRLKN